jgi:hypothetical protein
MPVRTYAMTVGGVSAALIVIGVGMAAFGWRGAKGTAESACFVAATAGAVIWGYWTLHGLARRVRPERLPVIHAVIGAMTYVAVLTNLSLMVPAFFRLGPWWQIPFMFGLTLAGGGWGRRVGDSMHCPECEYEFNFAEDEAPIRCPECGTPWLGRLKRGRKVRSYRLMGMGVGLAIFGALFMSPVLWLPWLGRSLPTPLLYAALYVSPRSAFMGWEELAKRQLEPRWTRIMAERVLGHREQDAWDRAPSEWLESVLAAGQAPVDVAERFYRAGFRATLELPRRVKVGETFEPRLRVTLAAQGKDSPAVMFGGYRIDDGPVVGRAKEPAWAHNLQPGLFSAYRDVFGVACRAERAGEIRVRAVYWVVYQPSYWSVEWEPDGTPARPGNAAWFEKREVEGVVRVAP